MQKHIPTKLVEDNLTPKGASPMGATPRKGSFNRVRVLNHDRTPAMPCTPARARRLLSAGKAAVLRFQPFMVILKYNTQGKQPLQLKTIPGAKTAGLALTLKAKTGCKVVWSAHHPSKPELPRPAHNDNSDSAGQGTPTPKYQHGNSNEINVFRGKSVAVPRQLLAAPQRTWSLKQIQQAARISSGLAFRVMNQLRTHHLIRRGTQTGDSINLNDFSRNGRHRIDSTNTRHSPATSPSTPMTSPRLPQS